MPVDNEYIDQNRERFIEIFTNNIKREGSARLLEWLTSSKCDFFTATDDNRIEGNKEGGLCEHAVKVYSYLKDYMANSEMGRSLRDRIGREFTDESIALVALLHELYKVKTFRKETDENGNEILTEDIIPYGMAEKSVYMISGFIRVTDDEAFAIRYHKGFMAGSVEDRKTVGNAMEKYALAYALSMAYMAASFIK